MTVVVEWRSESLPSTLLVIAPHQDDEVLGCGVLMRRVFSAGGNIVVAWMTDGGASHGRLAAERRRSLVERRRKEAISGIDALGIVPVALHFLDYPDGELGADNEGMAQAHQRLQQICTSHRVNAVAVTDGGDRHPDHRAAFAIASRLTIPSLYSYPISERYDGDVYAPPAGAVYIPRVPGDFKRAALSEHRSQSEAGGALYPMSFKTIERFCIEPEIFLPIARARP